MNKTNDNNARSDVPVGVIELGAISTETKGEPPMGPEGQGLGAGVGITE